MALIKCPECGHVVADTATECANCGLSMEEIMKMLHRNNDVASKNQALKRVCFECDFEFDKDSLACPNCGCPIEGYIYCSECNNLISEQLDVCPYCGNPDIKENDNFVYDSSMKNKDNPISHTDSDVNCNQYVNEDSESSSRQSSEDHLKSNKYKNDIIEDTKIKQKTKSKWLLWIVVNLMVLIIAGILGYVIYSHFYKDKPMEDFSAVDTEYNSDSSNIGISSAAVSSFPIPFWLIGTWRGNFNVNGTENYVVYVVIDRESKWTQTLEFENGSSSIEYGKVLSYNPNYITVQFQGDSSSIDFPIEEVNQRLGLGHNCWMIKQEMK